MMWKNVAKMMQGVVMRPARERGLKWSCKSTVPRARERGLKSPKAWVSYDEGGCRSREGAWIEMTSHRKSKRLYIVAPARAWIEMIEK